MKKVTYSEKFLENVLTNTKIFDIIIKRHEEVSLWYAAMAQLVEHILGKDEVPGPNPGSSSRHPRCSTECRGFGFI